MAATPENKVKQSVRAYLNYIGAYQFMPVQMGMGANTLDFLCCYKGRFLAIETKAEGKQPTVRQRMVMKMVREAGGIAFVAHGQADVERELKAEGLVG